MPPGDAAALGWAIDDVIGEVLADAGRGRVSGPRTATAACPTLDDALVELAAAARAWPR